MIEQILYDYLSQSASVPVYLDQRDASGKYIVIEKTGSRRENLIDYATIAIQSYADSMYEAASLNESVKSLIYQSVTLPEISAANLNSDYNFTDTTTKKYRYQAVFDFTYYGG